MFNELWSQIPWKMPSQSISGPPISIGIDSSSPAMEK